MNLKDSYFTEQIESDVTLFVKNTTRQRVLIFPPVNNYRRFLIHQFVQDHFSQILSTFSIGQDLLRRTVVCFKSDLINTTSHDHQQQQYCVKSINLTMGVEGESSASPSKSPENSRQRQVKSVPAIEIYRPPAARKALTSNTPVVVKSSETIKKQKRPDRAVYVPRGRRHIEEDITAVESINQSSAYKLDEVSTSVTVVENHTKIGVDDNKKIAQMESSTMDDIPHNSDFQIVENNLLQSNSNKTDNICNLEDNKSLTTVSVESDTNQIDNGHYKLIKNDRTSEEEYIEQSNSLCTDEIIIESISKFVSAEPKDINSDEKDEPKAKSVKKCKPNVLIISNRHDSLVEQVQTVESDITITSTVAIRSPDKKVKKMTRTKSKPAAPPASPPIKFNRDECDWDSLFDDNGECLDPTLIEELTAAVGEVAIEQPKTDYKPFTRSIEVSSSDEFGHVVEIYNFPPDFKTSDLAAVFSPFKNGGFELKWVDDTHCLGVFSSPLVAAEVLASDHSFVKTRPLSEATALSKTKARKSAEFLQPYRSRPETCAALARRLVTGALGVKLATARQEREHEKVVLREAKERRRLANKQREDAWDGIITTNK